MTMKRTISGMIGAGSLAHNRRDFVAENVDPDRVQLNICYKNENLKEVYKELFDDAVERYNVGKRKDRQIANYYEKIRQGKQEKLFHEVIFQIGNREDMAVGTEEGDLAVKVLDVYVKDFQKRNPGTGRRDAGIAFCAKSSWNQPDTKRKTGLCLCQPGAGERGSDGRAVRGGRYPVVEYCF